MFRVVLAYGGGITRSVFIKAKTRAAAEEKALRRYPKAIGIDHSPYPQN